MKADKIKIAEQRIQEAKERKVHFIKKHKATGEALYKDMAEFETESIDKIQQAIIDTLLAERI